MMIALALVAGALVGLSLGALGGGGAIVAVPALVYLVGLSPAEATTASLAIVGATAGATALAHARSGRVKLGYGVLFGFLGVGGTYAGGKLALGINPDLLTAGFALLLLVVATLMLRRAAQHSIPGFEEKEVVPLVAWHPWLSCACGRVAMVVVTATGVGLLTGFFGVGGGFVVVPALALALGFPASLAVGTSLVVIAINSTTALIGRLSHGVSAPWDVVAVMIGMALVGGWVGTRISHQLSPQKSQRIFASGLIVIGLFMLFDAGLSWAGLSWAVRC